MNAWRKSSRSAGAGECVEAGNGPGAVAVRDSRDRGAGPVLTFTPDAWTAFTAGLKAGIPGHARLTCELLSRSHTA